MDIRMPRASIDSKPEPRRVLTGAVLRASALLEITQSSLAQILGLSRQGFLKKLKKLDASAA